MLYQSVQLSYKVVLLHLRRTSEVDMLRESSLIGKDVEQDGLTEDDDQGEGDNLIETARDQAKHGDEGGQAEKQHDGVGVVVRCLYFHLRLRDVGFQNVHHVAQCYVTFGGNPRVLNVGSRDVGFVHFCKCFDLMLQEAGHLFSKDALIIYALNFVEHGGKHVLGQLSRVVHREDVGFGVAERICCPRFCSGAVCRCKPGAVAAEGGVVFRSASKPDARQQ
jgi:hypothetical protein